MFIKVHNFGDGYTKVLWTLCIKQGLTYIVGGCLIDQVISSR